MMIFFAFDIPMENVVGVPDWANKERYNIVASPPPSSESANAKQTGKKITPTAEQRKMLQFLLIERFHLNCHREIKEGPGYILTRGGGELSDAATKRS